MALSGRLQSLNVARARPVSIRGSEEMTAIRKRPVDGPRAVGPLERTGCWDRGEIPETYPSAL